MSYAQYMKNSRNHRKDRYYQQCSGYFGKSLEELEAEEKAKTTRYFIIDKNNKIIKEAVSYDEIILQGKEIEDKEHHWVTNSNMRMGRLDLACGN